MDRTEKAMELLERATKLGVRLVFDSGFVVAVKQKERDPERQDSLLVDLARHLRDIRPLVQQRAIAARANKFLGARILYPEFTLTQVSAMEGVLTDASGDGALTITIASEGFRHPQTVTAKAEALLVITEEEEADSTSSPHNDEPKSEQPRKGIFELFRRSAAGSSDGRGS